MAVATALLAPQAFATPITITGGGIAAGNAVTASATFNIVGNQLFVSLTNTSSSIPGQDVPGSTLTGVFFNIGAMSLALTPSSAVASNVIHAGACSPGPCTANQNVDGEFGYQMSSTGFAGGPSSHYGIASSGYLTTGLPQDVGNFNNGAAGANLEGPDSLDGINFGIISSAAGFDPNGGLDTVPLVQSTASFVLTGVGNDLLGLDASALIRDVSFQYGTAFDEANIPGIRIQRDNVVPEPATWLLFVLGLIGVISMRNRYIPLAKRPADY